MVNLEVIGKALVGCSFGMTASFLLGASSVGLWTLMWPTILLMAVIGGIFCYIAQEPEAGGPGGDTTGHTDGAPPPYSESRKDDPQISLSDSASARPSAPAAAAASGPTFVYVSPPVIYPQARQPSWGATFFSFLSPSHYATTRHTTNIRPVGAGVLGGGPSSSHATEFRREPGTTTTRTTSRTTRFVPRGTK